MDFKKQVTAWKQAATIGAMSGLFAILFAYFIGNDTLIKCVAIAVTTVFFTTSVYWWFWALSNIAKFYAHMENTKTALEQIKSDITKFKDELKN